MMMMNVTRPLTPQSIKSDQQSKLRFPLDQNSLLQQQQQQQQQQQPKTFQQVQYPQELYESELHIHEQALQEYSLDVRDTMLQLLEISKPNISLYKQQPYLTFAIRLKLVDFLLKMSVRLKVLPFVFFKAVKLFDRYCSKRVVLLDQAQLIITTCLWITSKMVGGNNHFVNLNNLERIGAHNFKTISDLGFGAGGKFIGPTERFRMPKLHELVKLCGVKCKYDQGMFKQMEVHVLNTLEWNLNDPSIEEFIVASHEFSILEQQHSSGGYNQNNNGEGCNNGGVVVVFGNYGGELFKVKEYLSYAALYNSELIDVNPLELGQVALDLINEVFNIDELSPNYQVLNSDCDNVLSFDQLRYNFIKRNLVKAVLDSSDFLLNLFDFSAPQFLYQLISIRYKSLGQQHSLFTEGAPLLAPILVPIFQDQYHSSRSSSVSSTESTVPRSTTPATTCSNSSMFPPPPQQQQINYQNPNQNQNHNNNNNNSCAPSQFNFISDVSSMPTPVIPYAVTQQRSLFQTSTPPSLPKRSIPAPYQLNNNLSSTMIPVSLPLPRQYQQQQQQQQLQQQQQQQQHLQSTANKFHKCNSFAHSQWRNTPEPLVGLNIRWNTSQSSVTSSMSNTYECSNSDKFDKFEKFDKFDVFDKPHASMMNQGSVSGRSDSVGSAATSMNDNESPVMLTKKLRTLINQSREMKGAW